MGETMDIPTKAEAQREARLRAVDEFLHGNRGRAPVNNGPQGDDVKNPKLEIGIEVGERPDGPRPYNPNAITAPEDRDWETQHGSGWTTLTPGTRRD